MYRVKETITSLVHGKQFMAGTQLYGNEFPAYAFAAMLADGVIEEIGAEPAPAADEPVEPVVEVETQEAAIEDTDTPETEPVHEPKKGKRK